MSDLIDRDEVIDAICNKCMLDHKMERQMPTLCRNCRAVKMIQAIPSARPKGKWIRVEDPRYEYDRENGHIDDGVHYECSECGWKCSHNIYPYCPNCNADMRGSKESEE